ncbi:complex I NDUFA9 subunit family protein [Roseomonas sp. SSH11]|uniref:Complex I NDUFA9 subunit family protein n=1 Tax=Pararoseomonas baculiformis TaxID=2820812 RepID=A0ABS4AGW4_9PROT|nr:complex I NDUFA9 subunit family protein [Pararoseomonas baculiformis]MBP0446263.1 complex I NDUFA9 subunit family protein [Pararoseomonas baculiformis]
MARRVAVVFGGTGFIGRHVVQRLAQRDYVVRVVTRAPEAARPLMTQGLVGQIVPLAAGPLDDGHVARAVAGANVAVNLVGILAEKREGDFARIHGALPGRVARHATAAGVGHLVHLSAIGADSAAESLYARSKAQGEAEVLAAFPTATILRPSIVFGPGDSFFNRFAGMARFLPVLPVVGGETRFQPVYVGDVADAIMAALERPDAAARVYELGGPRAASFRALMEYMLGVIRRRRRVVELPEGLARFQAGLTGWMPNPPLTRDQLLLLKKDNVVAADRPGLRDLGIEPKAMETILPGYLARFRRGGGQ